MFRRISDYFYYKAGPIAIVFLVVILLGTCIYCVQQFIYEQNHICVSAHVEMTYPTYIKSGNVMIPVGGGPANVCDEWRNK